MESQNLLEFYKILVGQLHYEGKLLWTRNQIFLVLNTAIVAIMNLDVFAVSAQINSDNSTRVAVSIIGIVLCVLWLLSVTRSQAHYQFWVMQIRSIEERMEASMGLDIALFRSLHEVYFGKSVKIGNENFRFDQITRFSSIGRIVRLVAWTFMIIWAGLLRAALVG